MLDVAVAFWAEAKEVAELSPPVSHLIHIHRILLMANISLDMPSVICSALASMIASDSRIASISLKLLFGNTT